MLNSADYAVVAFYLLFTLAVGWLFRKFSHDSSEYFRGGGKMSWWMVGSSNYMSSFSAWTFTGAAALAYEYGIVVVWIYWAGALAYFFSAWAVAAKLRQTRVVTVMEAVRGRLGPANEQVFTWLTVPSGILVSGIQLYGLAIFSAPVFGFDVRSTILLFGGVVIVVSAAGGSWAIIAGNFMQSLVLLPIGLLVAVISLQRAGGWGVLAAHLPTANLQLSGPNTAEFGVLWIIAMILDKLFNQNGINYAGKYLCTADSRSARRAAFLTGVLTFIGPLMWFLPALAARAKGTNLAGLLAGLTRPEEGVYVVVAHEVLPIGLMGVMMTAILATTMSNMDVGLNSNAGIFVRSFYRPILRPDASEREQVYAGRTATLVFGTVIVLTALLYSTWKQLSLFDLMLDFQALAATPVAVPMFWCLWIRRTPDWTAWSTVLFGIVFSAGLGFIANSHWDSSLPVSFPSVVLSWVSHHTYAAMTLGNILVCSSHYLGVATWWDWRISKTREAEIEHFFLAVDLPVEAASNSDENFSGLRNLGRLCFVYAAFVAFLIVLPNRAIARCEILFCSMALGTVASLLIWHTWRSHPGEKAEREADSKLFS